MIDIISKSEDKRAARLSNFTDRPFYFDGVWCQGIEGILQALKCRDIRTQKKFCTMSGRGAKLTSENYQDWKLTQMLWWADVEYPRHSREYFDLITRIYDAAYEQDPTFAADLLAVGLSELRHTIGNTDANETILTEVEMIYQVNRLRIRAMADLGEGLST